MFENKHEDKTSSVVSDQQWLSSRKRLKVNCQQIDKSFNIIHQKPYVAHWKRKSPNEYHLAGDLSQVNLMEENILKSYPERNEFFFLDIGPGEQFESIKHMSQQLNDNPKIPKDIRVHCIGIRGEKNPGQEIFVDGICTCYQFGSFKIEWLEQSFVDKSKTFEDKRVQDFLKNLQNKFDLIVTSWTLMHCEEPLGLLDDAFYFLRPGSGLMFFDEMHFQLAFADDKVSDSGLNNTWWLLFQHKLAFLYDLHSGLFAILKFGQEQHLNLGLSYKAISYKKANLMLFADTTTVFDLCPKLNPELTQKGYEDFFDEHFKHTSISINGRTIYGHPNTIQLMIDTLFPDNPASTKKSSVKLTVPNAEQSSSSSTNTEKKQEKPSGVLSTCQSSFFLDPTLPEGSETPALRPKT